MRQTAFPALPYLRNFYAFCPYRSSYILSLFFPTTSLDLPPDFVISDMLTPSSLARISIVLGEQKPD